MNHIKINIAEEFAPLNNCVKKSILVWLVIPTQKQEVA